MSGQQEFALQCLAHDLKPETEYRFHESRRWRFDFAWPEYKLAVEVDGGIWIHGRHNRPSGYAKDCEKLNSAAMQGWTVLRYPTERVKDGTAIDNVLEFLSEKGPARSRI